MYPLGRMYYWFSSRTGPDRAMIVLTENRRVEVNYRDQSDTFKIRDTKAADVLCVVTFIPKTEGEWRGEYYNEVADRLGYIPQNKGETLEGFIARVVDTKQREEDEERAILADPVRLLERLLKNRDWYYVYSDDHRVWLAGEAVSKQIQELIPKVPAEKVVEFWKQYAPDDMKDNPPVALALGGLSNTCAKSFAEIPDDQLRDLRENATASDMLDELEARV